MSFIKLDGIEQKEMVPGGKVRFVHTDNITLAYWKFKKGAIILEHSHIHEQVTNIIEGEFELTVQGKTERLNPGYVVKIEPNLKHSGKAITDCYLIDVFYPMREDYKNLTK